MTVKERRTLQKPFPYRKIIYRDRTRCNDRPINCRETALRRVLTLGNINSDATGFDIICRSGFVLKIPPLLGNKVPRYG
ncbi:MULTISPECIES: hypothetical protein [unclassified Microcoleus]|uniref:hypothetical protein n=1 Tax=unclassified Microcoleus TaxID=2642155 RepID=UPI001D2DF01F|nr:MULTISPECIES: hypothetical protein [unclassified Microcoleus]MCC3442272.1 hypothetical protein [Microcoleus sp. PH2017_03_ELD_O_A]MCC3505491.1 hypothetical protein [Microcoleus sp. PH2017_19_SFW_U_A]MCC3451536.1 hypothetical protein [Microcoleus sp. PH2017_09_SFU_O_A]MCC3476182.1 hypothetical protein [Microcoleus sp. PH2017_13_LAR_U_A]MCC3488659.1 hypothetical protein [Microcoleus sp. PH2017_14_LAR_D_A]